MTAVNYKLLKTLNYSIIALWDVKRYFNTTIEQKEGYLDLASVLKPLKKAISHEKVREQNLQIIAKINFLGNLFLRDVEEIETYKGRLFFVPKDSIIFSKINARQGCIYFNDDKPFVVSTEYPVFKIDENKVLGKYLHYVLRANVVKQHLNAKITGIAKARLSVDEFLKLPIPIPPINIQSYLIEQLLNKLTQAQEAESQADELEKGIEDYLLQELGIEKPKPVEKKRGLQLVSFKELSRWDCDFLENHWIFKSIIENGKFKPIHFGEILLDFQYGISEKSDAKVIGLPMLRMNNINRGELDISKLKYVEMKGDFSKLLLKKGDLLFNRTNSKELVGKTAIFNLDEDYLFASYLIRLNLDTNKADVHYVNYLFNSQIIRAQINIISRQIIGQANINTTELKNFLFPLPPKDIQTQIVNHITSQKEQIKALRTQAEALRKQAKADFENEIFN